MRMRGLHSKNIVLASIAVGKKSMSIKSDKTFEEIVERIIAVFRPHHSSDARDHDYIGESPESPLAESTQNTPTLPLVPENPPESSDPF
jgi:hypothetical protein